MSLRLNQKCFSDDDLETSQRTPFLNNKVAKKSNYRGSVFKLIQGTQRLWKLWNDIAYGICQEPTAFVVKNKPLFDEEKLALISIGVFAENDLASGTAGSFKSRQGYSGKLLNSETFSKEWNTQAKETNKLIQSINNEIFRENVWYGVIGTKSAAKSKCACMMESKYIAFAGVCGILFTMVTLYLFVTHVPLEIQNDNSSHRIPFGVQTRFEVSRLLATDGCFKPCKSITISGRGTPSAADWVFNSCGEMGPGSWIFIGSHLNNATSSFTVGAFAPFDIFEFVRTSVTGWTSDTRRDWYVTSNSAYWYNLIIDGNSVFGFSQYPPRVQQLYGYTDMNCFSDTLRCKQSLSIGKEICSSCNSSITLSGAKKPAPGFNYAIYKSTC